VNAKETKHESKVQGEGDYEAARRHRRNVERFVRDNDTEKLARVAKLPSQAETEELEQAGADGLGRKG
jgi:hypothetical protein